MDYILYYLRQEYALYSVTIPWLFIIYWFITEGRKTPPSVMVIWHWMLCVLGTYVLSYWQIKDGVRSLHMIDVFFIYLALYLWVGLKMKPLTAYALTYLCIWVVDMSKASQLIEIGEASPSNFFLGVGGGGWYDGLCFFPIVAAALVHYVTWRSSHRVA